MIETPRVVAVILNWDGSSQTARCARSIERGTYPVTVLIVDNESTDRTADALKSCCPDAELIRTGRNLGYAGGMNVGIRRALELNADFIMLLNNDTSLGTRCVEHLIGAMNSDSRIGLAGPIVIDGASNAVESCGGTLDWRRSEPRLRRHGEPRFREETGREDVEFVPGVAIFARAAAIRDAGLLPERYFLYFEDCAWSLQLRLRGWRTIVCRDARVLHWESSSAGKGSPLKSYYYVRNNYHFMDDWNPRGRHRSARVGLHWKIVKMAIRFAAVGRLGNMFAVGRGFLDYRRGIDGPALKP